MPAIIPSSTLILLTRNELEGVRALLKRLPRQAFDEILAIDGQSMDGTADYLKAHGIKVLVQDTLGRGAAFHLAVREAAGEHLVFFSPDGNENPDDLVPVLQKLREEHDLVIASRFYRGGRDEDYGKPFPIRRWGNLLFTWLANRCWNRGLYITDALNGFRGITKSAFRRLGLTTFQFDIEYQMTIRAMKLRLSITELPTVEASRIGGRSKAGTVEMGWELLMVLWREWYCVS